MELTDKRILVTGANGFIGSHLVARFAKDEGAHVRAMVRTVAPEPHGISSHSQIERVVADITDRDAVGRAAEGCQIIIHAAACQPIGPLPLRSIFWAVNVGGTENLLQAFHPYGDGRFLLLSTINVHGLPPPPRAGAESPLVHSGDSYSDSKVDGELAAWKIARQRGLPLTVIRPACTFGPYGKAWTLRPLELIRRGTPVLIGQGKGTCNPMYIDNLVDLVVTCLKNDSAIGQSFIGSQGTGVAWRDFYSCYGRMLGLTPRAVPALTAVLVSFASSAYQRLTGRAGPLAASSYRFYSHHVTFDVAKNARMLGYSPRISFAEGMCRTETWLRERNLI